MRRRRAVVTGGAGFVGSHLAGRLLDLGYEVLCLDNLVTSTGANLDEITNQRHLHFGEVDVTEPMDVGGPVDAVLHLASPASPVDYSRLPIETLKAGSLGTLNALELAKVKGARFLLASTSETYGDPQVHPQPETYWGNVNPVGPRAVYDEAKRFSEAMTVAFRRTAGVDTAIIRIFNTFGPRMRADDGRVIPTFITQALRGDPLTVAGDGTQTRSVCYVDDLVEGIVRMLHSGCSGPMNLGNPREHTVLELADAVQVLVGSAAPVCFVPRPQDDPMLRRPDISLARAALDWTPEISLQEGLIRTIAWFRERVRSRPTPAAPANALMEPVRDPASA
jgi:dTDP-glucose 4,6-dehydratase